MLAYLFVILLFSEIIILKTMNLCQASLVKILTIWHPLQFKCVPANNQRWNTDYKCMADMSTSWCFL